ncbi:hypothetical protein KAU88_09640 [Candidatus Bathyarchaeota archaeon]|nr:hypothetical protein [Candidatus Bathyarchaeota archaeon]
MAEKKGFEIIKIEVGHKLTVFTIDGSKDGCNQIVFRYGEYPKLESLMMRLFRPDEDGPRFNFEINPNEAVPKPQCVIKSISQAEQG